MRGEGFLFAGLAARSLPSQHIEPQRQGFPQDLGEADIRLAPLPGAEDALDAPPHVRGDVETEHAHLGAGWERPTSARRRVWHLWHSRIGSEVWCQASIFISGDGPDFAPRNPQPLA